MKQTKPSNQKRYTSHILVMNETLLSSTPPCVRSSLTLNFLQEHFVRDMCTTHDHMNIYDMTISRQLGRGVIWCLLWNRNETSSSSKHWTDAAIRRVLKPCIHHLLTFPSLSRSSLFSLSLTSPFSFSSSISFSLSPLHLSPNEDDSNQISLLCFAPMITS